MAATAETAQKVRELSERKYEFGFVTHMTATPGPNPLDLEIVS